MRLFILNSSSLIFAARSILAALPMVGLLADASAHPLKPKTEPEYVCLLRGQGRVTSEEALTMSKKAY